MLKVRNRSTRLYSVPVCKNDGSNTAVILLPVYAYKLAQNWHIYADDKKNIMCYNNIVYKWVRVRTHFFIYVNMISGGIYL